MSWVYLVLKMASNSWVCYKQRAIIHFLVATEGTVESIYKCLKNIDAEGTSDRSTEGCWRKFVRLAEQGNCTLHDQPPLSGLVWPCCESFIHFTHHLTVWHLRIHLLNSCEYCVFGRKHLKGYASGTNINLIETVFIICVAYHKFFFYCVFNIHDSDIDSVYAYFMLVVMDGWVGGFGANNYWPRCT
jgi:hypothetical protein